MKLVYRGKIDDSHRCDPVDLHEMFEIIEEYLQSGKVPDKDKLSMDVLSSGSID